MFGILSAFLWIQKYNVFDARPINSVIQARNVGENIARTVFPQVDYEGYEVTSKFDSFSNRYIVAFGHQHIESVDSETGLIRSICEMGGGGPEIHLDKHTGKIVSWGLQK